MSGYVQEDLEELRGFKSNNEDKNDVFVVRHLREWLTFVPIQL